MRMFSCRVWACPSWKCNSALQLLEQSRAYGVALRYKEECPESIADQRVTWRAFPWPVQFSFRSSWLHDATCLSCATDPDEQMS